MQTPSTHEKTRKATISLFLMVFALYLPALNGGFIWDDEMYITNNRLLRLEDGLKYIWLKPDPTHQYYPLTVSTFWLEFQLWGLWPAGYHFVNVLLHAINAVLLWRILGMLSIPGAWFAAAIFALHPVHVESVAWIVERKNVLSGFFYFSSLHYYLRFLGFSRHPETLMVLDRRFYAYALFLFFCGLLSKTAICSLPITILIVLWWKNGRVAKKDVQLIIPMIILGVIMGIMTIIVEQKTVGAIGDEWGHNTLEKILIAGRSIWFYATKLAVPYNLAFIYPRWEIDENIWWHYLLPAGVLTVILALVFLRRYTGRAPLAAVLYFCVTLGPALGIFSIYFMRFSYVADHFQYLASVGLITFFAGIVWNTQIDFSNQQPDDQLFKNHVAVSLLSAAPYRTILSISVMLSLGLLTWNQSHLYRSPVALWTDTITKNPESWLAHNNLGRELLNTNNYERAIKHFIEATRLNPNIVEPRRNLTLAFLRSGNFDATITSGLRTIAIEDSSLLNSMVGSAFWAKGAAKQAAAYFNRATQQYPVTPEAHYNLGLLYIKEEKLLHISSRDALAHLEKAFLLKPDSLRFRSTLAWILATFPDATIRNGAKAVILAKEGCERTKYRNPILLDALAAAYAESGQFANAVKIAQKAFNLAKQARQKTFSEQIQKRLHLYQSKRPYREVFFLPNETAYATGS